MQKGMSGLPESGHTQSYRGSRFASSAQFNDAYALTVLLKYDIGGAALVLLDVQALRHEYEAIVIARAPWCLPGYDEVASRNA